MKPNQSRRSVRSPAVAGSFYPSDPEELRASVGGMLAGAAVPDTEIRVRLLIVPHAGYVYSGAIAATVEKQPAAIVRWHRGRHHPLCREKTSIGRCLVAPKPGQLPALPLDGRGLRARIFA